MTNHVHLLLSADHADPGIRAERNRARFQNALEPGQVDQIRAATNGKTRSATIGLAPSLRAR